MDKKNRMNLFENYVKSMEKRKFDKALEQNRLLYHEIFSAYINSNGTKEVLRGGLDQLEIEATEILSELNNQEEKKNG